MKVTINIKTIQKEKNSKEEDIIDMVGQAEFIEKEMYDFIKYEETELTGMPGNQTVIKIAPNSLDMIRYGKNPSNMYFKEGVASESLYTTPYGQFKLKIDTKKLDIQKEGEAYVYEVDLLYDLQIEGIFEGENHMKIQVRKCREKE